MTETTAEEKYEDELEELLGSDEPVGTKEYKEMVEEFEKVSEDVEEYLHKSESTATKTRLTNESAQ